MRVICAGQLAVDGQRGVLSLPGESNCSKCVNQNATREDVNSEGRERKIRKSRNLRPKGLAYNCNIPRERRSGINGRLIKKYEDLH